ncbi:hypothetical protein HR51_21485 [Burkholderia cepacia]|nr:hypothetical protein HR51_21485 [Burkholderia cepacia]
MKQLNLVVDTDIVCRDALRNSMQNGGLDVARLYELGKVMKRLEEERPALVLMFSGDDPGAGIGVSMALRYREVDLRIIVFGNGNDVTEHIVALGCGADDFVPGSINLTEVLLRTRRMLYRTASVHYRDPVSKQLFRFDGFELVYVIRTLGFERKAVPLSECEYVMLNLFTTASGQVLSKAGMATRIWPDGLCRAAVVSVYVRRLRRNLAGHVAVPNLITTIRAWGTAFRPDDGGTGTSVTRKIKPWALFAAAPI